jgi:hypothetical protein
VLGSFTLPVRGWTDKQEFVTIGASCTNRRARSHEAKVLICCASYASFFFGHVRVYNLNLKSYEGRLSMRGILPVVLMFALSACAGTGMRSYSAVPNVPYSGLRLAQNRVATDWNVETGAATDSNALQDSITAGDP